MGLVATSTRHRPNLGATGSSVRLLHVESVTRWVQCSTYTRPMACEECSSTLSLFSQELERRGRGAAKRGRSLAKTRPWSTQVMHEREVDSLSIGREWDLESSAALRERVCCEGAGGTLRKRQAWVSRE
jgi:hypothetical protein